MKSNTFLLRSLIGAALLTSAGVAQAPLAVAQKDSSKGKTPAKRPFIVCIDPGHPSEISSGANAHGLSENRLNWQVAVLLMRRMNTRRITWITTKSSENQKVTNKQRADRANAVGADLMIRLHCDVGGGSGFSWYYPDRSGRHGGVTGPPRSVQIASRAAAETLNAAMIPVLRGRLKSNPIKTDASTYVGGKHGGVLIGSIHSLVPTALIEMCFINNKRDAKFIDSVEGQEKMADALEAGIVAWKARVGK